MIARLIVAAVVSAWSVAAFAADELRITFAAERIGEQPPYFTVAIGNTQITIGTTDRAMPSSAAIGHVFTLDDETKATYTDTKMYTLPEGALQAALPIIVTLTNAGYDHASETGTLMQILEIDVNGGKARLSQATDVDGGHVSFFLRGSSAVITGSNPVQFPAPITGWPQAVPSEVPAVDLEAAVTDQPVIDGGAQAQPNAETNAEGVVTDEPDDDIGIEAAVPLPKPVTTCSLQTSVSITGFVDNGDELSPDSQGALKGLASELAGQSCTIDIVGYSSLAGPEDVNRAVSLRRAEAALIYLRGLDVDVSAAKASGFGETSMFGAANANRRVVVTVSP